MQKLLIKGKKEIVGTISISGSKNATLPILAATILSKDVSLSNIPFVKDIFTMIELLKFIGINIKIASKKNNIHRDSVRGTHDKNIYAHDKKITTAVRQNQQLCFLVGQ